MKTMWLINWEESDYVVTDNFEKAVKYVEEDAKENHRKLEISQDGDKWREYRYWNKVKREYFYILIDIINVI